MTTPRLSPTRAAGKTAAAPIWNRAQRRAFLAMKPGELQMRSTRTAIRHTKQRVQLGQRLNRPMTRTRTPRPGFDWGAVVRASHRKGWPEVA